MQAGRVGLQEAGRVGLQAGHLVLQASGAMPVLIVGCGAAARCHIDAMRATGRFVCVAPADPAPTACSPTHAPGCLPVPPARDISASRCVALADTEPTAAAALSAMLVSRGGKPPTIFETLEEALDADPDGVLFGAWRRLRLCVVEAATLL